MHSDDSINRFVRWFGYWHGWWNALRENMHLQHLLRTNTDMYRPIVQRIYLAGVLAAQREKGGRAPRRRTVRRPRPTARARRAHRGATAVEMPTSGRNFSRRLYIQKPNGGRQGNFDPRCLAPGSAPNAPCSSRGFSVAMPTLVWPRARRVNAALAGCACAVPPARVHAPACVRASSSSGAPRGTTSAFV